MAQERGSAGPARHLSYTNTNQLQTLTWGAGDALTATFGYSGTQLVTVTTPYTQSPQFPHAWTPGYDSQGRLTSITSPSAGTPGQVGYTPAYTTQVLYTPGMTQTQLIEGYGTSAALTHTYTLDAQGIALQGTDVTGQGHIRTASFDSDHDVTSETDALGNTTLYTYTYVGPTGSVGLLTEKDQPAIRPGTFTSAPVPVITRSQYDPTTHDQIEVDKPAGGVIHSTYDGHHSVIRTTELLAVTCSNCTPRPPPGAAA